MVYTLFLHFRESWSKISDNVGPNCQLESGEDSLEEYTYTYRLTICEHGRKIMKNLFGSLLYGTNTIYEKAILRMSLVSQHIS